MRILFISLLIIFLSGCATRPHVSVEVDAISSLNSKSKKIYVLVSGASDIKPDDLRFQEFASYIEKALTSKGFVKSNSPTDANVVISLIYGIGDPQRYQETRSLPVFGQTGLSSSNSSGSISRFGNTAIYNDTTTYTPTYGITGFVQKSYEYETYFRYLAIDAIDLDEFKRVQKVVQLWNMTVTSTGSSGDLREIFPILVAASVRRLG